MLAKIAEKLSFLGMNVENLTTELRAGRSGQRDFVINADVTTSHMLEEEELIHLISDIRHLKEPLGLDILDVRVQKI